VDIAALVQWTSALQALTPPQQRELTQQLASALGVGPEDIDYLQ